MLRGLPIALVLLPLTVLFLAANAFQFHVLGRSAPGRCRHRRIRFDDAGDAANGVAAGVPNDALGRISSVFFAAEALATLLGALAGPLLAETISLFCAALWACALTTAGALAGVVMVPLLPRPWLG